jgi:hypothetical protein
LTGSAPYRPSWVDRAVDWIDRLPIPNWAFYSLVYLLTVLLVHLLEWNDGVFEWGTFDPSAAIDGMWFVTGLLFIHHLERVAERGLARFAPIVAHKPAEFEALRYRMTNLPARPVFWMSLITGSIVFVMVLTIDGFVFEGMHGVLSYVLLSVPVSVAYSLAPVLVYYGIRLLRSVTHAYSLVDEVDVFHQQPLYAFSHLTLQASLFWLVMVNINLLDAAVEGVDATGIAFTFLFSAPFVVMALLTFVVPLAGIHRRLSQARQSLLGENGRHVAQIQRDFHAALDAGDFEKVDRVDRAAAGLHRMRDEIRGVPTWPWTPGTFRAFLSAVFIPMLVWAAQQGFSAIL